MGIKKFVKEVIILTRLHQQMNEEIDERIKVLKKKIKDEENESKVLGLQMPDKK